MEAADHYLAHVEEGLGTKNLVADAVYAATGRCFYREIAIDTVATIVNDLATCGALPISVAMHAAVRFQLRRFLRTESPSRRDLAARRQRRSIDQCKDGQFLKLPHDP